MKLLPYYILVLVFALMVVTGVCRRYAHHSRHLGDSEITG